MGASKATLADPETPSASRMGKFPDRFAIRLTNRLALLACALRGFRRNDWRLQFLSTKPRARNAR